MTSALTVQIINACKNYIYLYKSGTGVILESDQEISGESRFCQNRVAHPNTVFLNLNSFRMSLSLVP